MEKFQKLCNSNYTCKEKARAACEHANDILAELSRVKKITRREYNTLYKKRVEYMNF